MEGGRPEKLDAAAATAAAAAAAATAVAAATAAAIADETICPRLGRHNNKCLRICQRLGFKLCLPVSALLCVSSRLPCLASCLPCGAVGFVSARLLLPDVGGSNCGTSRLGGKQQGVSGSSKVGIVPPLGGARPTGGGVCSSARLGNGCGVVSTSGRGLASTSDAVVAPALRCCGVCAAGCISSFGLSQPPLGWVVSAASDFTVSRFSQSPPGWVVCAALDFAQPPPSWVVCAASGFSSFGFTAAKRRTEDSPSQAERL